MIRHLMEWKPPSTATSPAAQVSKSCTLALNVTSFQLTLFSSLRRSSKN